MEAPHMSSQSEPLISPERQQQQQQALSSVQVPGHTVTAAQGEIASDIPLALFDIYRDLESPSGAVPDADDRADPPAQTFDQWTGAGMEDLDFDFDFDFDNWMTSI